MRSKVECQMSQGRVNSKYIDKVLCISLVSLENLVCPISGTYDGSTI